MVRKKNPKNHLISNTAALWQIFLFCVFAPSLSSVVSTKDGCVRYFGCGYAALFAFFYPLSAIPYPLSAIR